MIRLKIFISSVQKELGAERTAVGGLLATDEFPSRDTAWRTLARMVDDGVLEKTGTGRATRYRRRAAK